MMMTTWANIFLKTMRKTTTIEKIYYVEFKLKPKTLMESESNE